MLQWNKNLFPQHRRSKAQPGNQLNHRQLLPSVPWQRGKHHQERKKKLEKSILVVSFCCSHIIKAMSLLFIRFKCRFQQFFSHITTVSGCDRELNAHFYSATSQKYHAPDTWHDTTHSHIILTLGQPVLALPRKSLSAKREAASTIFNDFGMSRPGIEPMITRSPKRTLPTELPGLVCH